ncbi:MAG: LPXTG cell wall anchor domain-containing protein [Actinomycetota bacterium]
MLKRSGAPSRRSLRIGAVATVAGLVTLCFAGVAGAQVTATTTTTAPASTTTTTAAAGGVTPAGPITVTIGVTLNVVVTGTPSKIGPIPCTATGTVGADGKFLLKKADITCPPYNGAVGPVDATTQIVATSDWSGVIDPEGGIVRLNGSSKTLATVPSLGTVDCPVGPITLAASTEKPGGAAYNLATGKATVLDNAVSIPAIQDGTEGCFTLESVINTALGLPTTGKTVALTLAFAPKLSGSADVPTTTTTTVAPTTTAGTLPRTGSSSAPLAAIGISLVAGGLALALRNRRGALDA